MAESSGGAQTQPSHCECVQCGFPLTELPRNAQLLSCPQCNAEQKPKIRCVQCATDLDSPDQPNCYKCLAQQKPAPVPPGVKVTEPQTQPSHWECVQCGFALTELPRNAQLLSCPQCNGEQIPKTRCVQCATDLDSPDQPNCYKCLAQQKPAPVPPGVKVTEPQGNPNTSGEGNGKPEAYQPPELHMSEEETSPPHGQSPPGPIHAIEPPSPQPEKFPQESGSTEQQPSTALNKTPSPPSSPSSTEKDRTFSASLLPKDSDKQPLSKAVECSPTEENSKEEGPSKAALVTGKISSGEEFFDALPSLHKREAESHDSDSFVPKVDYRKVFGSRKSDKSAEENKGAASSTNINENERRQQHERQEQQKKQKQMEEADKEREKEETKNTQDNKVIQSSQ